MKELKPLHHIAIFCLLISLVIILKGLPGWGWFMGFALVMAVLQAANDTQDNNKTAAR